MIKNNIIQVYCFTIGPEVKADTFKFIVGNEFNRCYCHIEIKDNDEPFMLTILNKKGFNSFCYINNIKIKFIGC